ncbi:YciI family protein [Soonwooa sp.]|uniref:YciI family protein n=1 Tax=Soonwooa sp. TaxID=1938592 RepID=UPI002628006A|nr:YciI family protein [Soonwooa sp.]
MYVISLKYKKEIAEIEPLINAHNAFLERYYTDGTFIISGRKNPRTGGIIIANNIERETLNEIVKEDPFYQNEIADYEITEFIPTKSNEEFQKYVEVI